MNKHERKEVVRKKNGRLSWYSKVVVGQTMTSVQKCRQLTHHILILRVPKGATKRRGLGEKRSFNKGGADLQVQASWTVWKFRRPC